MNLGTQNYIDFYIKSYGLLLSGGGEVFIRDLESLHKSIDSTLHFKAKSKDFDKFAFSYSHQRLPAAITKTKLVVLGQSGDVFKNHGYTKIANWKAVTAPARRRKMLYDGGNNLAMFISSISDVDDVVTLMTAYQIEWNKLHDILNADPAGFSIDELSGLIPNYLNIIQQIKLRKLDLKIKQLEGSKIDYVKAVQRWWKNISVTLRPEIDISHRPLYVISSNLHSLSNLVVPFAKSLKGKTLSYIKKDLELGKIWNEIETGNKIGQKEDFLYYGTKKYITSLAKSESSKLIMERSRLEEKKHLHTVWAKHFLDINAQVLEVKKIDFKNVDPRIFPGAKVISKLKKSNALILNYDYPLGFGAYELLEEIMENALEIRGFYVLGKAATLSGDTGNVMIPNTVIDEHSGNTYFFNNAFKAEDVVPYLYRTSVVDSQKSVSVRGTFLQNKESVETYITRDISMVEMESGPYLDAIYEACFASRYPNNAVINLTKVPFDFGIINYASDTHYLRGKSLGTGSMSFDGISPTYVSTSIILKRIFDQEKNNC